MSKNEVIKSSWIIHITHQLSLLQHQIWNVLLAYAYKNLLTQDVHYLDVRVLLSHIRTTRNRDHLRKVLNELCSIDRYNLINKTNQLTLKVWRAQGFGGHVPLKHGFCLLANAFIEDGFCKYSFPPDLIPQLANPPSYAKINLLMQSKFSSKHSLVIYELCKDYAGIEQTPAFSINGLKNYLGIEPNEYPVFKHFNYKIIKKVVAEINEKSDLAIAVKFGTKNREDFVWFAITKKYRTIVDIQKLVQKERSKKIQPPTEVCQFTQLKHHGVADHKAQEIIKVFSMSEIQHVLNTMQRNFEKIINPGAFLTDAFNKMQKRSIIHHACSQDQRV